MGNRSTAVKFFNQALAALNDKSSTVNVTTSYQLFASACQEDPTWHQGWFQYGNNNADMNFHCAAAAAYRRALFCEHTPEERGKALINLGWRMHTLGRLEEGEQYLLEASKLLPNEPSVYLNLSQLVGLLDRSDESVMYARTAYSLSQEPLYEAALAFALLFNRKFAEGFKHFEIRFKWRLHSFLQYPYPKWEGEDDKTLFLVSDQGLGDTLSFSRFVRRAAKKCKYIHMYVQAELLQLFMYSFSDIPNINLLPFGSLFPHADCWSTFVSLPFALGLTDQEIRDQPHIQFPLVERPTMWMVPDVKLHIGIQWRGSKLNDIDVHRSIPVEEFLELYRVPGIQLYSLQVGEAAQEANVIGAISLIKDLVPYIQSDVTATLALMKNLDLIICCESAVAHIAALYGKECWVLYSYQGRDYRIGLDGTDRIWSPKHRIFRQGPDRQWGPVIKRVIEALRERLGL